MQWKLHVRFGGRAGETHRSRDRQALRSDPYTYIPTGEGWLYMSSVLDACSRRLLGWSLAGHMRTELVADALEAAVGQRGGASHIRGVVFHGDHGSQYTSDDYRKLCRRFGITQSMGTVGDSYDCDDAGVLLRSA